MNEIKNKLMDLILKREYYYFSNKKKAEIFATEHGLKVSFRNMITGNQCYTEYRVYV